jgi:hypothetical protein
MTQTAGKPGSLPFDGTATQRRRIAITAGSVDEAGRTHLAWTLESDRPETDGAPPDDEETRALEAAGGLEGSGLIDDRGAFVAHEFKPRKDVSSRTPLERATLENLAHQVHHVFLRLPEEPIGVGAVWDVQVSSQMFGMRLHLTATFELLEVDGNRVKVRTYLAGTAPPQDLTLPGMGSAKVHSFHVSGDGEATYDLDRLMPARSEGEGTMRIAFGRSTDEKPTFGFDAKQSERTVREE